jgi:hypothetical protein
MTVTPPGEVPSFASLTWLELEQRFRKLHAEMNADCLSVWYMREFWQDGQTGERWDYVGGDEPSRKRFQSLASVGARKIGFTEDASVDNHWLARVRDYVGSKRISEDQTSKSVLIDCVAGASADYCLQLLALGTPESGVSSLQQLPKSKQGRRERLPRAFTSFAAGLWIQKQNPAGRVSPDDLIWVGEQLDSKSYTPPAKYLQPKGARELRDYNSKHAGSKSCGPILCWSELAQRGDKDARQAMRKLLSQCASKIRKH